ncbi:MAG: 4'-phosphopantetheinyl transferase superfamily protein [Sneathiellaceae bacterium]
MIDFHSSPMPNGQKAIAGPDRVIVWWLRVDSVAPGDLRRLGRFLDEDEGARAARFHFERDRQIYVAAHALCRGMLSSQVDLAPRRWRFSVTGFGKPEAVMPAGQPRLRINISHTQGLAVAALAMEHDIGVDAEWLGRPVDIDAIAPRVFSPEERAALADGGEADRSRRFFSFWTLKEAYIKATGTGLSVPLDRVTVDLGGPAIRVHEQGAADPGAWRFVLFSPGPAHLAALAIRHPDPGRLSIRAGPAPLADLLRQAAV